MNFSCTISNYVCVIMYRCTWVEVWEMRTCVWEKEPSSSIKWLFCRNKRTVDNHRSVSCSMWMHSLSPFNCFYEVPIIINLGKYLPCFKNFENSTTHIPQLTMPSFIHLFHHMTAVRAFTELQSSLIIKLLLWDENKALTTDRFLWQHLNYKTDDNRWIVKSVIQPMNLVCKGF